MLNAEDIIRILGLKPLGFEGGFFTETWRSDKVAPDSNRSLSTAIYYLLTQDTCSLIHRLSSDETYHFHIGDPVSMLQLHEKDESRVVTLGTDLVAGQRPQVVVPAGTWQGSWIVKGGRFALMGTTMSPGFHIDDYESGQRNELIAAHPDYADIISRLTR